MKRLFDRIEYNMYCKVEKFYEALNEVKNLFTTRNNNYPTDDIVDISKLETDFLEAITNYKNIEHLHKSNDEHIVSDYYNRFFMLKKLYDNNLYYRFVETLTLDILDVDYNKVESKDDKNINANLLLKEHNRTFSIPQMLYDTDSYSNNNFDYMDIIGLMTYPTLIKTPNIMRCFSTNKIPDEINFNFFVKASFEITTILQNNYFTHKNNVFLKDVSDYKQYYILKNMFSCDNKAEKTFYNSYLYRMEHIDVDNSIFELCGKIFTETFPEEKIREKGMMDNICLLFENKYTEELADFKKKIYARIDINIENSESFIKKKYDKNVIKEIKNCKLYYIGCDYYIVNDNDIPKTYGNYALEILNFFFLEGIKREVDIYKSKISECINKIHCLKKYVKKKTKNDTSIRKAKSNVRNIIDQCVSLLEDASKLKFCGKNQDDVGDIIEETKFSIYDRSFLDTMYSLYYLIESFENICKIDNLEDIYSEINMDELKNQIKSHELILHDFCLNIVREMELYIYCNQLIFNYANYKNNDERNMKFIFGILCDQLFICQKPEKPSKCINRLKEILIKLDEKSISNLSEKIKCCQSIVDNHDSHDMHPSLKLFKFRMDNYILDEENCYREGLNYLNITICTAQDIKKNINILVDGTHGKTNLFYHLIYYLHFAKKNIDEILKVEIIFKNIPRHLRKILKDDVLFLFENMKIMQFSDPDLNNEWFCIDYLISKNDLDGLHFLCIKKKAIETYLSIFTINNIENLENAGFANENNINSEKISWLYKVSGILPKEKIIKHLRSTFDTLNNLQKKNILYIENRENGSISKHFYNVFEKHSDNLINNMHCIINCCIEFIIKEDGEKKEYDEWDNILIFSKLKKNENIKDSKEKFEINENY